MPHAAMFSCCTTKLQYRMHRVAQTVRKSQLICGNRAIGGGGVAIYALSFGGVCVGGCVCVLRVSGISLSARLFSSS